MVGGIIARFERLARFPKRGGSGKTTGLKARHYMGAVDRRAFAGDNSLSALLLTVAPISEEGE
jgi:hypothetical protein